jgi:hypothetical protein
MTLAELARLDCSKDTNMTYTDPDPERDPASIVLRDAAGLTVLGSHPLLPLRRRDDDEDVPDTDAPPPPPPPPPVSLPELALQFRPCLNELPAPPGFDMEAAVIAAVKEEVGPQADVRYVCANRAGGIGIWLRPAGGPCPTSAAGSPKSPSISQG